MKEYYCCSRQGSSSSSSNQSVLPFRWNAKKTYSPTSPTPASKNPTIANVLRRNQHNHFVKSTCDSILVANHANQCFPLAGKSCHSVLGGRLQQHFEIKISGKIQNCKRIGTIILTSETTLDQYLLSCPPWTLLWKSVSGSINRLKLKMKRKWTTTMTES